MQAAASPPERRRLESSVRLNPKFDRLILNTRFALIAGFGGLLVIITLAGIDTLRVLKQIRANGSQIRQEFLFRNHVLNDIRSDLYLSGTYVRDYLLEPDFERAESYRTTLEKVRTGMDSALEAYGSRLAPEESRHYTALKIELAQYWNVLEPVLQLNNQERQNKGYAFLRDEVFPRRMAMLDIANRIATLNEQQLNAGNERDAALLSSFQNRLGATLFLTVVLGMAMAAFSTRKILKLETRAHSQYEEVADARRQLENLSARLVQAQETERRALARELHDEVGQSLSAVLVELRNLSSGLPANPDKQVSKRVETIKDLVETTVRTVRNMSLLLRPSMLDDLGLIPALRWQAREVSRRTCMDVVVTTDLVSDDLPDEYKTCIYRVVQEALTNCARHAQATDVLVSIAAQAGNVDVIVRDNGVGFDANYERGGLGLIGMRERVQALDGSLNIFSQAETGTIIRAQIPIGVTA